MLRPLQVYLVHLDFQYIPACLGYLLYQLHLLHHHCHLYQQRLLYQWHPDYLRDLLDLQYLLHQWLLVLLLYPVYPVVLDYLYTQPIPLGLPHQWPQLILQCLEYLLFPLDQWRPWLLDHLQTLGHRLLL